jgi:hypothetical protein
MGNNKRYQGRITRFSNIDLALLLEHQFSAVVVHSPIELPIAGDLFFLVILICLSLSVRYLSKVDPLPNL